MEKLTEEHLAMVKIGQRVQTMRAYDGVPKFTEGVIVEDYGTGVMIAWDRPHNPIPTDMTPEGIGKMMAIDPRCPLRDGFDKESELFELVFITQAQQ